MRPRPQVPSRPPAEPCSPSPPGVHGHPLEVARQRLQVDGKPHPTAPSHPQAPKLGALQLGVRSLDTSPYVIPLAPLLGGLGPPAPLDVHLHQVRLEDVGPRTPVLHWATGSQGAGLACCPGKVDLYPIRRILQLVLLDGRVAGGAHRGLLPCDVDLKVRGGDRHPLLRASSPAPTPPPGSPVPFPGARLRRHCGPTLRRVGEELVRSDLPLREPVNDRHAHVAGSHSRGSPPRG